MPATTQHAHHANHHRLTDERLAKFRQAPSRSGMDRLRRREAGKRAVWSLVGHLRCCHGWRGNSTQVSLEDLERLHAEAHALAEA